MAIHFEDFCTLRRIPHGKDYSRDYDVIVEIVSRNTDGVLVYSVQIKQLEDEGVVFGDFPVKNGLIKKFGVSVRDGAQIYPVELNGNIIYNYSEQFQIDFFSHSSQKCFLSEIRRLQKIHGFSVEKIGNTE